MKNRSYVAIIRCLLLVFLVSSSLDGTVSAAMQSNQGSKAKGDSMDTAYQTESPVIPPIDAAAPVNFKTASFGLG